MLDLVSLRGIRFHARDSQKRRYLKKAVKARIGSYERQRPASLVPRGFPTVSQITFGQSASEKMAYPDGRQESRSEENLVFPI